MIEKKGEAITKLQLKIIAGNKQAMLIFRVPSVLMLLENTEFKPNTHFMAL